MILHLKKDSSLLDPIGGHRFSWAAGQHSVEDELGKRLLNYYPDIFEEITTGGITLAPNPNHTTPVAPQATDFTCEVCGKVAQSQLGLLSHKRTHARGITTADIRA